MGSQKLYSVGQPDWGIFPDKGRLYESAKHGGTLLLFSIKMTLFIRKLTVFE